MAYFNSEGFYTTEVLEGRYTEVEPPYLPAPEGLQWNWTGFDWRLTAPVVPTPVTPPVWAWYIDIGPFSDRFGVKAFAVDSSPDPFVQSFNRDLNRRKWVDLKDPRVAMALGYLAGQTVPGIGTIAAPILTPAEVNIFLTTPVQPEENLALRKLYFS